MLEARTYVRTCRNQSINDRHFEYLTFKGPRSESPKVRPVFIIMFFFIGPHFPLFFLFTRHRQILDFGLQPLVVVTFTSKYT